MESWLIPDGKVLRLYDRNGRTRLTGEKGERDGKERLLDILRQHGIKPDLE